MIIALIIGQKYTATLMSDMSFTKIALCHTNNLTSATPKKNQKNAILKEKLLKLIGMRYETPDGLHTHQLVLKQSLEDVKRMVD